MTKWRGIVELFITAANIPFVFIVLYRCYVFRRNLRHCQVVSHRDLKLIIIIIIIIIITLLLYYLLTYLLTATELSLGGSSPYASTDKTNKNKYT